MLFVPLQLNFGPIQVKRKIPVDYNADRTQTLQIKGSQAVFFNYNTKK